MRRHRRFRYGSGHFRPWMPFRGWWWIIGLVFLFSSGRWWPGIFVLIGLMVVFGSLFREDRPQEPHDSPPPPAPMPMTPPTTPTMPYLSMKEIHRTDLLPATCPNCGGPVRLNDVKWTGPQTAVCAYCGSNLKAK